MTLLRKVSEDMTISFFFGHDAAADDTHVVVQITTPENTIEMRTRLVRLAIDRDCEPEITPDNMRAIKEIAYLLGAMQYLRGKE